MQDSAKHLLPPAAEPWMLEMQLSGGNAFSQLRDKLDSTLSVDYRSMRLECRVMPSTESKPRAFARVRASSLMLLRQ